MLARLADSKGWPQQRPDSCGGAAERRSVHACVLSVRACNAVVDGLGAFLLSGWRRPKTSD